MNILCLFFLFLVVVGCTSVNQEFGLPDDNPFEQAIEDVIRKETGIEIDFTPDKEGKNVS